MPNVLIIDDNTNQLGALTDELKGAGVDVNTAEDVVSGLEKATREVPQVIVCTEELPGLDAVDLLEIKGKHPNLSSASVLVLGQNPENRLECLQSGCDDYVVMPLSTGELLRRIQNLARQASGDGVAGDFKHINILNFIQMLMSSLTNGKLNIDCGEKFGTLCFDGGQVFHSSSNTEEGEDAFLSLLREAQNGGKFDFHSGKVDKNIKKNIDKRTDHLLLGLANRLDEED